MRKIIIFLVVICLFIGCKRKDEVVEKNPDNTLIQPNNKNKAISKYIILPGDTAVNYYSNGKVKEKGRVVDNNRFGWWLHYNKNGVLMRKSEFIIRNNVSFLNQNINYTNDDDINYSSSSFFKFEIADTIKIGKTIGKLKYYSDAKGYETKFVYIIIENQYSEKLTKKDTFTDKNDKLWFGVNAYKRGKLKLKGIIEEELSFVKKDSSEFKIEKRYKYFEKELYVN